jgi:hypothetical protein
MRQLMVALATVKQEYRATVVDTRSGDCYVIRTTQSSIVDAALDISARIAMPDRRNIGMNPHIDFRIAALAVESYTAFLFPWSTAIDFEIAFPRP